MATIPSNPGWISTSGTTTSHTIYATTSSTSAITVSGASLVLAAREAAFYALDDDAVRQYLGISDDFEYICPDGTKLAFERGNVTIVDENSKIVYKSNPIREFNRYLNASDLLEEFIEYCKKQKVNQAEFMNMPVQVFIAWLIVRTAEEDGEDPKDAVLMLEDANRKRRQKPKCKCCGKFLNKNKFNNGIHFCNGAHMDLYAEKIAA